MEVTCQFSLYPLGLQRLGPPIAAALQAMRAHGLDPQIGPMSSLVRGPAQVVFAALADAFAAAATGACVLEATVSNACASSAGDAQAP
jgi:uncharacterized protein YqgV (UPF0045/DUF77 family)